MSIDNVISTNRPYSSSFRRQTILRTYRFCFSIERSYVILPINITNSLAFKAEIESHNQIHEWPVDDDFPGNGYTIYFRLHFQVFWIVNNGNLITKTICLKYSICTKIIRSVEIVESFLKFHKTVIIFMFGSRTLSHCFTIRLNCQ